MEKEIRAGLKWSIIASSFNSIFCILTVFGSIFLLFLTELGIPKYKIGILLSFLPFFGIIAPFLSSYVEYFGSKKTFLICFGIRKFVILSLVLLPLIIDRFGRETGINFIVFNISLFAFLRAFGETGYYAWAKEFIPDNLRGKYVAIQNIITNIAGIFAVSFGSYVIGKKEGIEKYLYLIVVAFVFGILSVYFMSFVPFGEPKKQKPSLNFKKVLKPLIDKNFLYFLFALGISLFGCSLMSFIPIFVREKLCFSSKTVVFLDNATILGSILIVSIWGSLGDRFGGRPVIVLSLFFYSIVVFLWLTLKRDMPSILNFTFLLYFLSGATLPGRTIGDYRFLYTSILQNVDVIYYTSIFYAWIGIFQGISPIFAGYLLERFKNFDFYFLGKYFDIYSILFLINLICQISAIIIYRKVKPDKDVKTRALLLKLIRSFFD
ncbi:MAG: MFS transporter [Candidatus Ratteibacteria bacterium]